MVLPTVSLMTGSAGCSQGVVECGWFCMLNVGKGRVFKVMEGHSGILK